MNAKQSIRNSELIAAAIGGVVGAAAVLTAGYFAFRVPKKLKKYLPNKKAK